MRFAVPLTLAVALAAAWSISKRSSGPPADYRFISAGGVNILDPAMMSYVQDIRIALDLWEGLTTWHPRTVRPMGGVAYFPPEISEDQRTYTFTLRPDARWSNGDRVTAADFVRGWRRALEPGTADVYAELLTNHIAGAAQYATWRTEHVSLLGLVRRRQRNSPVQPGTVADVLASDAGAVLRELLEFTLPEPVPARDAPVWERLRAELEGLDHDWRAWGDRLLEDHVAELEPRFARVGLRVLDDRHLQVRLRRPVGYFLDLTSMSTFVPIHESIEILRERYQGLPLGESGVWAHRLQWTKPDYHAEGYPGLVSNGAYRLTEWTFRGKMRLEKNPYYWDAEQVRSSVVELVDVEYENTGFMLYEQGVADQMDDLMMEYTPDLMAEARAGRRDDIHAITAFGTYFYDFNCRPTLGDGRPNPLADAGVRRALARAVNKQELVDRVLRRGNPVSDTYIPRGQIPGYDSPDGLSYDPEAARRELARAGYPGGDGLGVIDILYNTGFNHEKSAQAVKRMWERELGVRVQLVGKETKTFAQDKIAGRFSVGRASWYGDYFDPTTFLDLLHTDNGHNTNGFSDAAYDGLLAAAADERDPARRLAILRDAERILVEEQLPVLPLYTYVNVYAWRPDVKGIWPNVRLQFPTKYIYVDRP